MNLLLVVLWAFALPYPRFRPMASCLSTVWTCVIIVCKMLYQLKVVNPQEYSSNCTEVRPPWAEMGGSSRQLCSQPHPPRAAASVQWGQGGFLEAASFDLICGPGVHSPHTRVSGRGGVPGSAAVRRGGPHPRPGQGETVSCCLALSHTSFLLPGPLFAPLAPACGLPVSQTPGPLPHEGGSKTSSPCVLGWGSGGPAPELWLWWAPGRAGGHCGLGGGTDARSLASPPPTAPTC